jgi:hypothetical protein
VVRSNGKKTSQAKNLFRFNLLFTGKKQKQNLEVSLSGAAKK